MSPRVVAVEKAPSRVYVLYIYIYACAYAPVYTCLCLHVLLHIYIYTHAFCACMNLDASFCRVSTYRHIDMLNKYVYMYMYSSWCLTVPGLLASRRARVSRRARGCAMRSSDGKTEWFEKTENIDRERGERERHRERERERRRERYDARDTIGSTRGKTRKTGKTGRRETRCKRKRERERARASARTGYERRR